MGCNCKHTQIIIGIVILVFTFWIVAWSQWIVAIAAILLILHALKCKACGMGSASMPVKSSKKKRR